MTTDKSPFESSIAQEEITALTQRHTELSADLITAHNRSLKHLMGWRTQLNSFRRSFQSLIYRKPLLQLIRIIIRKIIK